MQIINQKLEDLYNKYYPTAIKKYKEQNTVMSNPLMLKVDENAFAQADKIVMICGEETYGWWEGVFGDKKVEELMTQYDGYLHNTLDDMRKKTKRAFWNRNGFKWWEERIQKEYPNEKIYVIWNNLVKIGQDNEVGMTDTIRTFENQYFHTLLEEIEILKPDMMIFFSNDEKRDIDFKNNFEDVSFNHNGYPQYIFQGTKTPLRVLSKHLPSKTIKLYHPSYRNLQEGYKDILKETAFQMLINEESITITKEDIENLFWTELSYTLNVNLSELELIEEKNLKNHSLKFNLHGFTVEVKRTWRLFLEIENQEWKYITFNGIQHQDEKADDLIDFQNGNANFWRLGKQKDRELLIENIIKYIQEQVN
jgi:hypothetical protein